MNEFLMDRKGQAGGVATFVILVVMFSFLYIVLGVLMDKLGIYSNDLMETFFFTQEHYDAMEGIFKFWNALPVIVIVALMVFLIKNAIRARTGEV